MTLPSYRAIFDREGVTSVGDTAVAGSEAVVAKEIQRYFDAGATSLLAVPVGTAEEQERTVALLGSLTS